MVSAKLSAPKGILFGPRVKETKRSTVVSERSIGVADHQDGLFTAGRASLSGAIWRRLRDADLSCRTTYRADTVEPDLRRPAEARADDGDAWNTRAVRWKLEQFGFSSNWKKVLSLCFYATPCGKPEPLCWNCFNNIGTLQAHFRVRLRIGLPATTSRNQRAMTQIGSCLPRPAGRGIASAKSA